MRRLAAVFALTFGAISADVAPAAAPIDTVSYGDRVLAVAAVQQYLSNHGYTITIDGWYGPQTFRAVTHFQRANGLVADGIVGPRTQRAMGFTDLGIPVNPPPAVARPAGTGADRWHDLAITVGWTEAQWPVLRCIIWRESRGQPDAKNPNSSATGLTQILARYYPGINLYDPTINLTIALSLYRSRGWQPWTLPGNQCT